MRNLSDAFIAADQGRAGTPATLIHIFAARNGGIILPDGFGSWTYSLGFKDDVDFTDLADFAGDGAQLRTYTPGTISIDPSQTQRSEKIGLDPLALEIMFDPTLDPFANYVNENWQLVFGIVIYKVFRAEDGTLLVVDSTPPSEIRFFGYLDNEEDGVEITIDSNGKKEVKARWDSILKKFDRATPRPVFGILCPKTLFSTGPACLACNADKEHVRTDGVITAINGTAIQATEWGAFDTGWFANGRIEFDKVDPVSGKTFTFVMNVASSRKGIVLGVPVGDLTLSYFPPLLEIGDTVRGYGGCDRLRPTCVTKHLPIGGVAPSSSPAPGDTAVVMTTVSPGRFHIKGADFWLTGFTPGTLLNPKLPIGISINGDAFAPVWTGGNSNHFTPVSPALPATGDFTIAITQTSSKTCKIVQQPTAGNGYEAIISVPASAFIDLRVLWGQVTTDGNLQNFGGADIPIENPTFETTR